MRNLKSSARWFLRIIPISIGLLSGIVGIFGQCLVLFSDNPNPLFQKQIFYFTVWFSFFISAIWAWLQEFNRANIAEKAVASFHNSILIEVKEIKFSLRTVENEYLMSFGLEVTNTKSEITTLKDAELIIDTGDYKETGKLHRYGKNIKFEQGIPQYYPVSFKFNAKNEFNRNIDKLAGKQFVLNITDSYDVVHKISGVTDLDLIQNANKQKQKQANLKLNSKRKSWVHGYK